MHVPHAHHGEPILKNRAFEAQLSKMLFFRVLFGTCYIFFGIFFRYLDIAFKFYNHILVFLQGSHSLEKSLNFRGSP